MAPQVKKKQHHVAQVYLRAWATNDQLNCLVNGEPRTLAVRDAGSQNRFYAAKPLTELDIQYIRRWIELSPPDAQKVHAMIYKMLATWQQMLEYANTHEPNNTALIERLQHEVRHYEEEYHSKLENRAAPILEALRRQDLSFYRDDDASIHFLHFIALQLFRTKAVKDKSIAKMRAYLATLQVDDPWRSFEPENSWNILSHILAVNVSRVLYLDRKRRRVRVIDNKTGVEFITGDMPVLNLARQEDAYCPYYPLSPTKALFFSARDGKVPVTSKSLTIQDVDDLNRSIIDASLMQVYASSKATLERYT